MSHHKLKRVISVMSQRLEAYCQRHDSSKQYIELQNSLISDLVQVHNSMSETLEHFLSPLEREILRLEALDPNISGHRVLIRTKAEGEHFTQINMNIQWEE